MAIYDRTKDNTVKVDDWLKRNEKLGTKDYITFLIDYLDYDENDNEHHLKVFFLDDEELEIFVDRQDFKYTLEFLETFNELYWVD